MAARNLVKCKVRVTFENDAGTDQLIFRQDIATYIQVEDNVNYRLDSTYNLQEEETSKCLFDENHKVYRICPHCRKELT